MIVARYVAICLSTAIVARVAFTSPPASAPAVPDPLVARMLVTLKDAGQRQRQSAANALGEMGPEARSALPALLAALRDRSDPIVQSAAAYAVVRIDPNDPAVLPAVVAALDDPDSYVRSSAADTLGTVWPPRPEAVPTLARFLKDKDTAYSAAVTLGNWGPEAAGAVPALIEAIESSDPGVSAMAIAALGKMGPVARPAVTSIIAQLRKPGTHRAYVAFALAELGATARDAEVELIRATQATDAAVRMNAAFALGRMGCRADELPAFAQPLKDDQNTIRSAFTMGAAGKREPAGSASIYTLLATQKVADPALRSLAHDAVTRCGSAGLPVLFEAADSDDVEIRRAAAWAISSIGRMPSVRANAAIPAGLAILGRHVRDPESGVRVSAAGAIASLRPSTIPPGVLEAMQDPDYDVRMSAAVALGGIHGDPAATRAAITALKQLMNDDNRFVRYIAVSSVGNFGPAAEDAVPLLIAGLRDRDQREFPLSLPRRPLTAEEQKSLPMIREVLRTMMVRDSAALALRKIGPGARAAVPALIEQLKDEKFRMRSAAIDTIGAIGPDASGAVPELISLLKGKDRPYNVFDALAQLGEPGARALLAALHDKEMVYSSERELGHCGRDAVPAIVAALAEADPELQTRLITILGNIGPRADGAAVALIRFAKMEPNPSSLAAIQSLGNIGPGSVPTLIELLGSWNKGTRIASMNALIRIGPDAKAALPTLGILTQSSNEDIADLAARAVAVIEGDRKK